MQNLIVTSKIFEIGTYIMDNSWMAHIQKVIIMFTYTEILSDDQNSAVKDSNPLSMGQEEYLYKNNISVATFIMNGTVLDYKHYKQTHTVQ